MSDRPGIDSIRPWLSGDALRYGFEGESTAEGSSRGSLFKKCSDITKEYDEKLCKGWEQDLDALLVFAGLFSAVVSTFVVETYKNLSVDPQDQIVVLLEKIVAANTQSSPPTPDSAPFEPEGSTIRINIFFFVSLIASLSAALLAILCKQWLREYQRDYPPYLSPKRRLAARQSRYEGLVRWRVPGLVTVVPFLLQVATALFFVGLIYLLWPIHRTVAVVVTIAVTSSLLGIVITTVLAPLLILARWIKGRKSNSLGQCPYKTPVGWIMIRMLTVPFLFVNQMLPERKQFRYAGKTVGKTMEGITSVIRTLHWSVDDVKFGEGHQKKKMLAKSMAWLYPFMSGWEFASCLGDLDPPTAYRALGQLIPFLTLYRKFGEWTHTSTGSGTGGEQELSLAILDQFLGSVADDDDEVEELPAPAKKDIIVISSLLYRRKAPNRARIDHLLERCIRIMNSLPPEKENVRLRTLSTTTVEIIVYLMKACRERLDTVIIAQIEGARARALLHAHLIGEHESQRIQAALYRNSQLPAYLNSHPRSPSTGSI
ncbi:hypothetical protein V5O48_003929 [Marasmius crinis-equi]|uniref:DUF6535 domain-containing protein n=1 Tax=Marasmius crinis-equi TaxID=585013 RepID=A0ABR3FRK1_9AGAR